MLDGTQFVGAAVSVGANRVALTVTEPDDAHVARGMFQRFALRHGASEARADSLATLGTELTLNLVSSVGGGLIEAERVGSFIEVRAIGRSAQSRGDHPLSPPPRPEPSWKLDQALQRMDGTERSDPDAHRMVVRTWCGLE